MTEGKKRDGSEERRRSDSRKEVREHRTERGRPKKEWCETTLGHRRLVGSPVTRSEDRTLYVQRGSPPVGTIRLQSRVKIKPSKYLRLENC